MQKKTFFLKKSKNSTRNIAKRALKQVSRIKKSVETKYCDTFVASTASYSGSVYSVSQIAQGDTQTTRDGIKVGAKSLHIKARVAGNSLSGSNQAVRCILVCDKEQTGTAPTASDILENTGNVLSHLSPYKWTTRPRYQILYDKIFGLSWQNGTTGTQSETKVFNIHKRLKKNIFYSGAASTDAYKNNLYLLWISDVGTNDPLIFFWSRLFYTDM